MNYFALGFVGVIAVVGLGVDYHQQSVKADLPLGQMGLDMYVETYEARFLGAKAEARAAERERQRQANWKQGGIQYLPEAPEGWTRRKYSEGVNTAIMFEDKVFYEELSKSGGAQSLAENLKAQKAAQGAAETDKHSYVYERGNEAVFVSVNTKNKVNDDSFGAMIGMSMGGMSGLGPKSVLGYQVVGGVGFVELPIQDNLFGGMASAESGKRKAAGKPGFRRAHFRRLVGTVGFNQEVLVTVHANASTESTLGILNLIDWHGLNEMLATPMALVGNDVILPDEMDPAEIAMAQYALRSKFNGLRSQVANFKMRNLNEAAFLMNVYSKGAVDVTGGAVPDLSALVEGAFRKEMRDLMAGRPSDDEYSRILSMIEERPEEERENFEGEMSDELKRELYGATDAQGQGDQGLRDIQKTQLDEDIRKARRAAAAGKPVRIGLNDEMREELVANPAKARAKIAVAVALMEKKKGYPQGSCALNEAAQEIHCQPGGQASGSTTQAAAKPEASSGGGFMGALKGMFGGGGGAATGNAAPASRGEAQVVVRSGQGKAGVGAGAGNCSYEGAIKRCTVGN